MSAAVSRISPRMHASPAPDRRPTAGGSPPPLIERTAELTALGDAIARVESGRGAVVVLEAAAGLGKTALLEHGGRLATGAGFELRRAAPGPLERDFPYGVVRALLEGPLRLASARERTRLLDGAAGDAVRLLLGGGAPGDVSTTVVAHSMFWLCSALAGARPLALAIDDAQWADRASLEVLSYLARRIDELPLLIAIGARADDPDAPSDLLSLLGGVPAATVLRPRPLTVWGAVALIRRHAPEASLRACRDGHSAASGSPWLLAELGRQIAAHGPAVFGGGQRTPVITVVARDVVRRRLAALTPRSRSVAAALAVLGHGAPLHVVAALAGVAIGELAPARDALAAAGLLAPGRARFAHGLIATAVLDDLSSTERERLHREAARLLTGCDASIGAIAGHLLECGPDGDPEVSRLLIRAAADAARRGTPLAAARYLERALQERGHGDDRGELLAQSGIAGFDGGLPGARRRLHESLRELRDGERRVDVLTRLAGIQALAGGDKSLPNLLGAETGPAIAVATLDALAPLPERRAEWAQQLAALAATVFGDPALDRAVLAHRAWAALEHGSAEAAAKLALEALDGDVLLRDATRRAGFHLAVRTLILTGRNAEARRAIDALREQATARGSVRLRAAAAWYSAELALRTGAVREAELEARAALELSDDELNPVTGGALAVLVGTLAERGAFDDAAALLHARGLDGPLGRSDWELAVRHARARLWLAMGDYQRAHAEASDAGTLSGRHGRLSPAWASWRSTAAVALAHLGRLDEAARLAGEDVARAEAFGAAVPLLAALHARASAESDGAARIALCRRALRAAAGVPAVLDVVRIRLELGSALSRTGARLEAREELRPALADADAAGAVLLAERARRELVSTGLRPRQAAIEGAAALTPRQHQICALAAAGRGNREIAQALFVSVKTVETHLAAGYRKLGINSRADLGAALEREPSASDPGARVDAPEIGLAIAGAR
jgi:DNA-binding CsgD family transcriptional regulator